MATEQQLKLPRGIRAGSELEGGRTLPHYVKWRIDGQRRSKWFALIKDRDRFAKSLVGDLKDNGMSALRLNPDEMKAWRAFRALIGEDADLNEVAEVYLAATLKTPRTAKLATLRDRYFELRAQEKSWGDSAQRHSVTQLERFCAEFGELHANKVTPAAVRGWMANLRDRHGDEIGAHGRLDHLKNVRTFFSYIMREKWARLEENPCAKIVAPRGDDGDPVVIPVADAVAFFAANAGEPFIARLALEAFGGLRTGTAGKITRAAIGFDKLGIRMAAKIHKSGQVDGRSRYRQGHPANLWEWLRAAPDACWALSFADYREAKKNGGIRAGIRPLENKSDADDAKLRGLRNIWRHSFISYHLAVFKNPPLTQYLAQHTNLEQTLEYEGLCDESDGRAYFAISPGPRINSI